MALSNVVNTLGVTTTPLPSTNAAQKSISVVVTDSAGTVYPAVLLTGAESTPWSWAATYADGPATAVVTALDINGATIGAVVNDSFVVPVTTPPATFEAPGAITSVLASTSAATAAVHAALKAGA
jgi:hypothetical protein